MAKERKIYMPHMSTPNDWGGDQKIVHVSGNLWWNKTTNVKFYLVNEERFFKGGLRIRP